MSKKFSRRTFLTVAAVAPVAVVSACSSDSSSTDASVTGAPVAEAGTEAMAAETTVAMAAETEAMASEAAAAPAGEVTGTLNFLNFTGWAGPTTYDDFAKAFPGAKVNEIAWASADDAVSKAKDRAGDIDLLLVDGTTLPRLTALGVLAKLGEIANMSLVADRYKNTEWDPKNESLPPPTMAELDSATART